MPPMPPWNAFHPMWVHMPIGVLSIVPLVLIAALALPKQRAGLHTACLILMLAGTIAAFVATMSGEAADEWLNTQAQYNTPMISYLVHEHEETGELARNIFAGLTIVFILLLLSPRLIPGKLSLAARLGIEALLLVGWFGGIVVLANAGHQGGEIVHSFGVHAPLPTSTQFPPKIVKAEDEWDRRSTSQPTPVLEADDDDAGESQSGDQPASGGE